VQEFGQLPFRQEDKAEELNRIFRFDQLQADVGGNQFFPLPKIRSQIERTIP
jgi:hypothetical protein